LKITDVTISDPMYVNVRVGADATVDNPAARAMTILRISTDEGITGIAMAGDPQAGPNGVSLNRVLVESVLKPYVVGQDPLNTERIWDKMYWGSVRYGRRGVALSVIGAIDIALWDLKGKILNQPMHKLLGGHRDTVAAYGSSVNLNYTKEELSETYADFVEDGFKMVKMKIGKRDPNEDLERVKLVRETIGPNVDLALDVNSGWSLGTAIRMADKLEQYDIYWLEEPLPPDEIDNHAKLAAETSIPIALGETHATKWEFKELIERGAVEVVQADIVRCGGVTEWIKIAAMADAYGLPMCPHGTSDIAPSLVAAVPNGLFVEWFRTSRTPVGERDSMIVDPIGPANGEISPSIKPGFGLEIDEEVVMRLQGKPKPSEEETRFSTKRGWQWPPYL
jgi:L-alanine-DL-glutamate epimerase-like enolase superfamily enzyme